ncbi:MAG: class I SAM-dependent methyltransferase [Candidatus Obscuribacter sp.]|mgnify:CR=1 FL=1|nr:class I SAM-dependent methyltransferase [Candidatus Obscuribacter sp.]
MSEYLYDAFESSSNYRDRLIEVLRNNTNIEMGGYRMFDGTYAHAIQIPEELADFIIALKQHDAEVAPLRRMLEVGFAAGITNTLLNKFFGFDEIVAMDTFDGPPSTNVLWANLRFKNLTLVCGDSGSERSISTARSLGPFDLIFIDGDHSYEGVKRDIENYSPMLSEFGVFAMHDIAADWTGVPKAWRELVGSGNWSTSEFVCPIYQRPFGIGIARRR